MRFLPTSSIDKTDPPEPFIHATDWGQFRMDVRNNELTEFSKLAESPLDLQAISAQEVDACFEHSNVFFLGDEFVCSTREDSIECDSDFYDLELGLLEAVQEIAASLARTPARRAGNATSKLT